MPFAWPTRKSLRLTRMGDAEVWHLLGDECIFRVTRETRRKERILVPSDHKFKKTLLRAAEVCSRLQPPGTNSRGRTLLGWD